MGMISTKSQKICKCECGKVEELLEDAETSRIIQFLMWLNDSYTNIQGQIINKKNRPSLTAIYNMLDQDQSQRMVGTTTKGYVPPVAFQLTTKDPSESTLKIDGGVAVSYQQRPRHVCGHCGMVGHLKERCYKVHGYPPVILARRNLTLPLHFQLIRFSAKCYSKHKHDINAEYWSYLGQRIGSVGIQHDKETNSRGFFFFSSKLISPSTTPLILITQALPSTSVPHISQLSGTFLCLYPPTYYDF